MRPHFILPDRVTSTATFLPPSNRPVITRPVGAVLLWPGHGRSSRVAVVFVALPGGGQRLSHVGGLRMSFATFGPLPRPQPNPIPGLPALEAAIRRLEAITVASPPDPLSTCGEGRGEVSTASGSAGAAPPSSIWLVVAALLARIDPDTRYYLHRLFARTLEAAEEDLLLSPEQRRLLPKPLPVQQQGRPCAQETAERFQQGQPGIDRLLRQALWRAVDALEAAALLPPGQVYLALLAEQCAQFEHVYQVLKRRAGRFFALSIFEGELHLLRHHRGSMIAERLLFD